MTSKKQNKVMIGSFIFVESLIYFSFMWLDIVTKSVSNLTATIKFLGIILCFAFVLCRKDRKTLDGKVLILAMFFTVISDLYILVLDKFEFGMVTFVIVQLLYLFRIDQKRFKKRFVMNLVVWCIFASVVWLAGVRDIFLYLVSFYFLSILRNTWFAVKEGKDRRMFSVGMILFVCCDVNVGLFNLSSYVNVQTPLFGIIIFVATYAMWFFYLPSQIFIALSDL